MKFRKTSAALAATVVAMSAAATVSPANAVEPGAQPGPRLGDVLIDADMDVTVARIDGWLAAHPDATAPGTRWVNNRMQRTGASDLFYLRSADQGYCLLGHHPGASLTGEQVLWRGTGIDGTLKATFEEITAGTSVCASIISDYQKRAIATGVKSDLKYAALVAETWIADHPASTKPLTMQMLVDYGLWVSDGNTIEVWGNGPDGYCLRGTNPALGLAANQGYWYDSVTGGLAAGVDQPTDGACGQVVLPLTTDSDAGGIGPVAEQSLSATSIMDGGIDGVITAGEVDAFMRADLIANKQVVRDYIANGDGRPTNRWAENRMQRTGTGMAGYVAPKHSGGYCLYTHNRHSTLGGKHFLWAGSDIRGARVDSVKEMANSDTACGRVLREFGYGKKTNAQHQKAAILASLKSDVKNAATAAETIWTDRPESKERFTMKELRAYGFRASEGNTVRIWGSPTRGYCVFATNPKAGLKARQGVWYDSSAGGIQTGVNQPKSGFCSKVKF